MKPFNWGIIGPGSIAKDFTNDLKYVRRPQAVTAVLSHRKKSAVEFAEQYKVKSYYTDLKKFLDHQHIDAVYIATPHTFHFDQALACLERGIPVLCEKPLVINASQAKKLHAASKKNKTLLIDGMWIRFLPSIQKVLQLISSGAIGKVRSVKASMSYHAPKNKNNRYFDPELGGGSLLDLGIYPVFLAQLLLGVPQKIKAIGNLSKEGIDETCAALFQYKNDEHAFIESSIITRTELSAEIGGDKASIKILSPWNEMPEAIVVTANDGKKTKRYPCKWKGRGFQYEVEEVLRCIKNGQTESRLYDHQFSIDIMETLDKIRRQIDVKYKSVE